MFSQRAIRLLGLEKRALPGGLKALIQFSLLCPHPNMYILLKKKKMDTDDRCNRKKKGREHSKCSVGYSTTAVEEQLVTCCLLEHLCMTKMYNM